MNRLKLGPLGSSVPPRIGKRHRKGAALWGNLSSGSALDLKMFSSKIEFLPRHSTMVLKMWLYYSFPDHSFELYIQNYIKK